MVVLQVARLVARKIVVRRILKRALRSLHFLQKFLSLSLCLGFWARLGFLNLKPWSFEQEKRTLKLLSHPPTNISSPLDPPPDLALATRTTVDNNVLNIAPCTTAKECTQSNFKVELTDERACLSQSVAPNHPCDAPRERKSQWIASHSNNITTECRNNFKDTFELFYSIHLATSPAFASPPDIHSPQCFSRSWTRSWTACNPSQSCLPPESVL